MNKRWKYHCKSSKFFHYVYETKMVSSGRPTLRMCPSWACGVQYGACSRLLRKKINVDSPFLLSRHFFHRVHASSAADSTAPLTFLARGTLSTGSAVASTVGDRTCPRYRREPRNSSRWPHSRSSGPRSRHARWHPPYARRRRAPRRRASICPSSK
jgi:hypothetical protein